MSAFAARYARAFADAVLDARLNAGQVNQQLSDFAGTLDGSRELREVLFNPSVPAEKRVSIMDAVNQRTGGSRLVRNFLAVLINHERLSSLDEIFAEFRAEMNRRLGIAEAQVTTARPLDAGERAALERQVAAIAGGAQVRASFAEDRSLIGGAIVRIGSTVYDGSVRGRLERLRERLVAS